MDPDITDSDTVDSDTTGPDPVDPDPVEPEAVDRPLPRGSWRRGDEPEFSRLANFTDAIYAIALTLLVLQLTLGPIRDDNSPAEMLEALEVLIPNFIAFALAFLLLARYWMAHHAFFATLRAWNEPIMAINLVYLAFVALLPFPTYLVGEYSDNPLSVVVFAASMAAISGLEVLLYARAHHFELMQNRLSRDAYRWGFRASTFPVVMFVATMPLAFISPIATMISWPVLSAVGAKWLARTAPSDIPEVATQPLISDRSRRLRQLGRRSPDSGGPPDADGPPDQS